MWRCIDVLYTRLTARCAVTILASGEVIHAAATTLAEAFSLSFQTFPFLLQEFAFFTITLPFALQ